MTTDEGMKFAFIIAATEESPYWDPMTEETAEAIWDEWIARVKRDTWDACYHQMVTAPARGVTVTKKSNPYAPERRVAP